MRRVPMIAVVALAAACRGKSEPRDSQPSKPQAVRDELERRAADEAKPRPDTMGGAAKDMSAAAPRAAVAASPAPAAPPPAEPADRGRGDRVKPPGKASEGATRSWFPETFLFEPLIVTDEQGAAVVPVRVPDRLTTWRVLALAHARTGGQAGAVASFLGTLPIYVDPVVPPFLVEGDTVRVPIQVVNTTAAEVTGALEVSARNARLIGAPARPPRRIPAQGSTLDYATLAADRAGPASLRVALGAGDAVERTFEIRPVGRRVRETRSGTLAAPRSFTTSLDAAPGAATAAPPDRVRLVVFAGALAVLRSELAVSTARSEVADDAYALLLAGRAATLLAALGDTPDREALRALALVTAQRAIRDARTLDVERASLLAAPALAHPGNPVLARLGERAAAELARLQRPDGTFAGETGWTLQRLLVATADATRAVAAAQATRPQRQRARQVATRAAGAFARNAAQVSDGYTAAAMLASGAVTGEQADALRRRVRAAIHAAADGGAYLAVGDGIVRGDGTPPTAVEATALAVLALAGDPPAQLADLGTTLLGAYAPLYGWGDGRVNLVAMQAVLALFTSPLPSTVTVTLTMDGAEVVHGRLEGAKLRDLLALDAERVGVTGRHRWQVTAEPAVPGLGYALTLDRWLPWVTQPAHDGLELALPSRVTATIGEPVELTLTAVAPSGVPLHLQQALPAGVQLDEPSLAAAVASHALDRFHASDGAIDLYVAALKPGATLSLRYRAIPTLAGTLHSGPSTLEAGGARLDVAPSTWTIAAPR